VCWKPCSSCWSFHLLREEFLSAPIHSPPLWFAVSVLHEWLWWGVFHVPLMCDSTSAISVAKNLVLHSRTKHIEVRYHFSRDNVEKGNIDLIHVPTEKQLADILTKPLDQATFARLRGELKVVFLFEPWLGGLMYICMLHFILCIISCLHAFVTYAIEMSFSHMLWSPWYANMRLCLCLWCSWDV
jgi:hypothetical protein